MERVGFAVSFKSGVAESQNLPHAQTCISVFMDMTEPSLLNHFFGFFFLNSLHIEEIKTLQTGKILLYLLDEFHPS